LSQLNSDKGRKHMLTDMPPASGGRADAARAAEAAEQKHWISAPRLARQMGISRRTLARWLRDIPMGFPRPTVINSRLYFCSVEVDRWRTAMARRAMGEK
jgi:predicted DNA-binding transcriptional regulator AlpA